MAALSGYNLKLEEDNSTNRLIESLRLFFTLSSSKVFLGKPFILFLNKTDLFRYLLGTYPTEHVTRSGHDDLACQNVV